MAQRDYYIDRLRTVMTALVIFAHTAMTYGGAGNWFYIELGNHTSRSGLVLTLFILTCNAFLLGFFFLLAGYYAPASLDRKGYARYAVDRCLRLGLPVLIFGFILAPATIALGAKPYGYSMRTTVLELWRRREFIDGPMWFAWALLVFSLAYCLFQMATSRFGCSNNPGGAQSSRPVPPPFVWILSALGVGLASLLLRQVFPLEQRNFGLWLGNFASYIFLFPLGIIAWHRDWLSQLTWRMARPTFLLAFLAWPVLPVALIYYLSHGGKQSDVQGFAWPHIVLSLWEPIVAWGIIAGGLLWFRARFNSPSALWSWLGRRAFAVYLIHPLTLVAVCVLLRHLHGPALIKFALAGTLGCITTWLAADPLVRLPGLRQIL